MADLADDMQSFNDSLVRLQQKEKDGGNIDMNGADWKAVYSAMSSPDITREASARMAYQVATKLQASTPASDAAWSLFHEDVSRLEQDGDVGAARKLMGMAITSDSGLSGVMGKTAAETISNLQNMTDDDIARLSPDARTALMKQLGSAKISDLLGVEAGISVPTEVMINAVSHGQKQFDRLAEQEDKNAPGEKQGPAAVSKQWSGYNASRYFDLLDKESKRDLPAATNALVDVMLDPATKGSSSEATMWNVFSNYIGRLTSRDPTNKERYPEVADRAIEKLLIALPPDDPHIQTLLNLYDYDSPSGQKNKEQKKPDGSMGAAINKATAAGINARYTVSDPGVVSPQPTLLAQGKGRGSAEQQV